MMRSLLLGTALCLSACAAYEASEPTMAASNYETIGAVTMMRDGLVAPDAKVEKLGGDFIWSEGPVWIDDGDYLLFTDVPGNTVYKFAEDEGITVWMSPSGFEGEKPEWMGSAGLNGLIMAEDRDYIIAADHGNRAVYKVDLDTKEKTVLTDSYEGKRLNSPNDVVLHKSGIIYFTDPPYGLQQDFRDSKREYGFNGVFALYPDGSLKVIDDSLFRPNGIILSPDQKTLYVANADPEDAKWMAYPVADNGDIGSSTELLNATEDFAKGLEGNADGMAVDVEGNIWATGPGGVIIFSPEGERLGLISTGSRIANVTFGDDGYTLYMTSHSFLARVRTQVKGLGF